MKNAIIIGCLGQDGEILTDLLIKKKFNVYGISKKNIYLNNKSKKSFSIYSILKIKNLLIKTKPVFVFYLAGYKHSSEELKNVKKDILEESYKTHVVGYKNFLESIMRLNCNTKIFYACSSHIYGPQKAKHIINLNTPLNPISPYGITKTYAYLLGKYYRNRYNLKIYTGIFCNHESETSSDKYILSKIINKSINLKLNRIKKFEIGSLADLIDIGYAKDYIDALFEIVNYDKPKDFIISAGNKISINLLIKKVFKYLKLNSKNKVIENKNILAKQKKLNLFGSNHYIRHTKSFKKIHSIDQFIKKIIDYRLSKI